MANTSDLRYVRTEAAIRSAFMQLVAEEPVASVTASAVCRRAGISRNAFYLHYPSVQGLYAALVGEFVDDVRAESVASAERRAATGDDEAFSTSILSAIARHEDLLRALLPADDGSLSKCLAEGIEDAYATASLILGERAGSFEYRVSCAFSAWAAVGLVSSWIAQTDRPLTEARRFFDKAYSGLAALGANYVMGAIQDD